MKVFLAGEGVSELGDWVHHPSYRVGNDEPGVIQSLLFKLGIRPEVVGALKWTDIPKFKSKGHLQAEARNVLGAALEAQLAGADALVFVRDRDGKKAREEDIEDGIRQVAIL